MKEGKFIYSFPIHVDFFIFSFITLDSVTKLWDKLQSSASA